MDEEDVALSPGGGGSLIDFSIVIVFAAAVAVAAAVASVTHTHVCMRVAGPHTAGRRGMMRQREEGDLHAPPLKRCL